MARLMSVPKPKRDPAWVLEALQAAVQLELSTIPPYLYARWSIDPDGEDPGGVESTIRGIVREEMLHMGIASNLLVALGGRPDIVALAPSFPTQLPKDIHHGLVVELAPLSTAVVRDVFMAIEEPEVHLVADPEFPPSGSTLIGHFYEELFDALVAIAPKFVTDGQISMDRPSAGHPFTSPFVIADLDDARAAIDVIRRQGEGTAAAPFENKADPTELAHFYQFGEILHGRQLTREAPFAYTGDEVPLPTVRAVLPAPADLPAALAFDQEYSRMLHSLEDAWATGDGQHLEDAIGAMFGLRGLAEDVIAQGFGPAFRVVEVPAEPTEPPVEPPSVGRFLQVTQILDAAVGPTPFGAHGAFWRGLTRDQFVARVVFGEQLPVVGDGAGSNLVKALRGELPFGNDTGTAGADFRRMPAGRPPVPEADIAVVAQWIDDGCPDTLAQPDPVVSDTTGAFRPDPQVHVDYFRDLDDWSAFNRTPEVDDAINVSFGFRRAWLAYARDAAREPEFVAAISGPAVLQAVTLLAERQQQTVETHYGVPVPLLAVLDGYERFGNDGLPDDPLRPQAPRHRMDGVIMWFMLAAFAEACVRLGIAAPFWTFMMRPVLCGLLNDGLFRDRFTVEGFAATTEGRNEVFAFAQSVADADLPAEIRKRFAESGLV